MKILSIIASILIMVTSNSFAADKQSRIDSLRSCIEVGKKQIEREFGKEFNVTADQVEVLSAYDAYMDKTRMILKFESSERDERGQMRRYVVRLTTRDAKGGKSCSIVRTSEPRLLYVDYFDLFVE